MMRTNSERLYNIRQIIYTISYYLEYLIAFTIIAAILLSMVSLPYQLGLLFDNDSESFIAFLQYVMNLVIGLEFLHVICRHNLDSVIEVLMLTITRGIIIDHVSTMESLLGIIAVAILFLVRKYLYISKIDKSEEEARMQKAEEGKGAADAAAK